MTCATLSARACEGSHYNPLHPEILSEAKELGRALCHRELARDLGPTLRSLVVPPRDDMRHSVSPSLRGISGSTLRALVVPPRDDTSGEIPRSARNDTWPAHTIAPSAMSLSEVLSKPSVRVTAPAASRSARLRWEALQSYGFLAPAVVLLVLFHLAPVGYALFLSLFDARVFRDMWNPGPFIGAGNYGRLLTNAEFAQSLGNTIWYAAITVPLGLALAVFFAQLLNARIWGRTGYRVTYFLPYVTSTVAAAVVWRWIFQPRVGIANWVLQWLGLPGQQWADEPRGVLLLLGQFFGLTLPPQL